MLDAEIAFVAETPNEDRESQHSPESRKERYGAFNEKVRSDPIPGWIEEGNRFADSFFEDISADFAGEREQGIYFTNIKKCADIDGSRVGWKNRKAKLHCEQYLEEELAAVDPDIVVTFGKKATTSLFDVFDSSNTFSEMKEDVLDIHRIDSYSVIPSYHWSYLHLNIRSLEHIEDKADYWDTLAKRITSTVNA